MKKETKKIIITSTIAVISIILLYFFYLFVTIDGKIVEDRPLLEKICKIRSLCYIREGEIQCERYSISEDSVEFSLDEQIKEGKVDFNKRKLANWEGYAGCNESTKGFNVLKGDFYIHKYIEEIDVCTCETFFG